MAANGWSKTWTFFEGDWHEGNVAIFGPRTHAAWLGSSVFDGARAFEGVTPDLDPHCARVNDSAPKLGLKASVWAPPRNPPQIFQEPSYLFGGLVVIVLLAALMIFWPLGAAGDPSEPDVLAPYASRRPYSQLDCARPPVTAHTAWRE